MIDAVFRPMDTPVESPIGGPRRACPFSASWVTTLDCLERELQYLRARDIVIELDTTRDQIRNDGWPRSTATVGSPGVRLSFAREGSAPLSFACGTYRTWQDNLRAIGLTLERLRAIARYGCVQAQEQYRGWSQLPPGAGSIATSEFASLDAAIRAIYEIFGLPVPGDRPDPESIDRAYRHAARMAHPDAGGDGELMSRLNRARDFVEAHA